MRPEGEGVGCTQLAFEPGSGKGLGAEVAGRSRWGTDTLEAKDNGAPLDSAAFEESGRNGKERILSTSTNVAS